MHYQANWVALDRLSYRVGSRWIFRDLNMTFPSNKLSAILGPSGSGKSSLLNIISGQQQADAVYGGKVTVNGQDMLDLSDAERARARKRMGRLFQNDALFTEQSVFDNVAFALREHSDLPESMIRDVVLLKLNAVGLHAAERLYPSQLSAGMARRVALARALVLDPQLMLFDEPFAGQDPIAAAFLRKLIEKLCQSLDMTGILVSNNVDMSLSISDYIYLIHEGRVIDQGTPEQIRQSKSRWVQQFLRGDADGPVPFQYPGSSLRAELLDQRGHGSLFGPLRPSRKRKSA